LQEFDFWLLAQVKPGRSGTSIKLLWIGGDGSLPQSLPSADPRRNVQRLLFDDFRDPQDNQKLPASGSKSIWPFRMHLAVSGKTEIIDSGFHGSR
jgi:hypothetical protein